MTPPKIRIEKVFYKGASAAHYMQYWCTGPRIILISSKQPNLSHTGADAMIYVWFLYIYVWLAHKPDIHISLHPLHQQMSIWCQCRDSDYFWGSVDGKWPTISRFYSAALVPAFLRYKWAGIAKTKKIRKTSEPLFVSHPLCTFNAHGKVNCCLISHKLKHTVENEALVSG